MRKTSDILWQDAQHQVLFTLLDQLRLPSAEHAVLQQLRQYTETHFTLEERYMEQLDFPGLEDHVRAHDRFREEIDNAIANAARDDALFRELISTFLTEWLTRHVFGIDKKLEAFILASDMK
jgi:hemerythrin